MAGNGVICRLLRHNRPVPDETPPPDNLPQVATPAPAGLRRLFRQEAIDAQRERLFGEVSLARPVPIWVFTLLALAFAIGLIAFLVFGQFSRRESVDGFLELDAGAARISINDPGTLAELFVREGDEIEAGAPIARMTFESASRGGAKGSELVQKELNEQLATLDRQVTQEKKLGDQQADQLRSRANDLQKEMMQIDGEIKLQRQRIASAQQLADRYQQLMADRYVSDIAAQQKRDDVTDQQVKLESLKRERTSIERNLREAQVELPTIATRTQGNVESFRRQGAEVQQKLVLEESRRETLITAPIGGVVTNIAMNRGQSVIEGAQLATVVPRGSGLHAELLVPTRAIGFIQPGDEVQMRYEAFPFQRFGQYRGSVVRVSRAVWSAGERVGPLAVKEPVYRVDVKMDAQDVTSRGQAFALRPGMLVNADILLERRSVVEWLFEPVLGLRERFRSDTDRPPQ
ncbi:HlyD family efflux transporter periplasmic adaptor subunit [soil metagenome]